MCLVFRLSFQRFFFSFFLFVRFFSVRNFAVLGVNSTPYRVISTGILKLALGSYPIAGSQVFPFLEEVRMGGGKRGNPYLQSVLQTSNTFSVIKGTSAAISTLHEVNGYESPTEGKLCGQIRSAGERILGGRLVNQKEPLEWDVLHSYCIAACASGDFMRMLVAATALLAFSAFLRYSDVVSVYADEVKVFDTHAEIFLEKRKADQLRLGSIIVVARAADVRACPVRMLVWAISVTGSTGRHVPVFRRVDGRVVQWHPERARETYHRSEAMPYDQCSRYVLRFLAQHAKRSEADFRKEFGTQSLRSGGATAVAAAGVDSRMFQRHGGWRSTGCMNLYIKDSLEARLAVTRALPYAKGAAECE